MMWLFLRVCLDEKSVVCIYGLKWHDEWREGSYIAEVREILGVRIGNDVRLVVLAGLGTRCLEGSPDVVPNLRTSTRRFPNGQSSGPGPLRLPMH
jgi:hypothetical protein